MLLTAVSSSSGYHTQTSPFGTATSATVSSFFESMLRTTCHQQSYPLCFVFTAVGLDYTNNFSGNKSPDSFLYNFLADLYGSVDGSRAPNVTTTNGGGFTGGGGDDSTTDDGNGGGTTANQSPGSRRLETGNRHQRRLFSKVSKRVRRRYLESRWIAINALVSSGFKKSDRIGWRLLHRTEFGEAHEMDLDDEYKVQVHLLLA